MPSRSKFISRVSADMPGMGETGGVGKPSAHRRRRSPHLQALPQADRCKALTFNWLSFATAAKPAMPTRFSVPARRRSSWPPPWISGSSGKPSRTTKRADAGRAADLVGGNGHHIDAEQTKIDRDFAEGLHRIGVHQRAMGLGKRHDFTQRLNDAGFIVGEHDADQRLWARQAISPRASRSTTPCGVDGNEFDRLAARPWRLR